MKTTVIASKCYKCLNSRVVVSENGWHPVCCLSDKRAMDCLFGKKNSFISNEERMADAERRKTMELEAVWLRDGREIYRVDPVRELCSTGEIENIAVSNGWAWYHFMDICDTAGEIPNGFLIRERKS